MKRALIIPDCHIPFVHKKAYSLMLKVAKDFKPDEIVILGDYLDFYSVSSHKKDPTLPKMLKDEIDMAKVYLDEIDKLFPDAYKVFLEGNHEYRLSSYLQDKAPELFGLVSVKALLDINRRRKWRYIPYSPQQKYNVLGSKLFSKHTPIGSSAKTTVARGVASIVYGHTHRIEQNYIVGIDGSPHVAINSGWLGDARLKVFEFVKNHHEWQLGFTLAYVVKKLFYHQIVPILPDISCVFHGKRYTI